MPQYIVDTSILELDQEDRNNMKWLHAGAVRYKSTFHVTHEIFFSIRTVSGLPRLYLSLDHPGRGLPPTHQTHQLAFAMTWDDHLYDLWKKKVDPAYGWFVREDGPDFMLDRLVEIWSNEAFVDPWSTPEGRWEIIKGRIVSICDGNGHRLGKTGGGAPLGNLMFFATCDGKRFDLEGNLFAWPPK